MKDAEKQKLIEREKQDAKKARRRGGRNEEGAGWIVVVPRWCLRRGFGARYVLDSQCRRLSGDERAADECLGAGAGWQNRRYRRENRPAQGHQNRRRQRAARVSRDDRFGDQHRALRSVGRACDSGYRRTGRVHAAASRSDRGESGERAYSGDARERDHQRDDVSGGRRSRRRPGRRSGADHFRAGGADSPGRLDMGRHGNQSFGRGAGDFSEHRRRRPWRLRSRFSRGDFRRRRIDLRGTQTPI